MLERKVRVGEEVEGTREEGNRMVESPSAGVLAIEANDTAESRETVINYGNIARGEYIDERGRNWSSMGPKCFALGSVESEAI